MSLLSLADKDRLDLDEDSLGVCPMRNSGGLGNSNSCLGGGGGGNGSGSFNQFLGPLLWDRNLPAADGSLFQLQYMDLEEFLTENGMGNNNSSSSAQIPSQSPQSAVPNQSSQCLPPSSPHGSLSSSPSSSPSLIGLEVAQPQGISGNDCVHGELASRVEPLLHPPPQLHLDDNFEPDIGKIGRHQGSLISAQHSNITGRASVNFAELTRREGQIVL